jgi:HPt (histidine-containing phosphotransfer) domain-containing protein
MDFNDLALRLGIDEEEFKELVELFIATSFSDIEKIKNGVLDHNPSDAAAASHSIKGAAGNLGFDEIFSLAGDMEMQARGGNLDNFDVYIRDLEIKVNALNKH